MNVYYEDEAWQKVKALVENCKEEIMGLGKVRISDRKNFIVTDVIILPQDVTEASAEFDKDALVEFFTKEAGTGTSGEWRLWWHSHCDMGVFWSITDTDNIKRMGDTADWMVSTVFNHKMETLSRLDVFRPFELSEQNLGTFKYTPRDPRVTEWAKKEIEDKVKTRIYHYKERDWDKRVSKADTWVETCEKIEVKIAGTEPLDKNDRKFIRENKIMFDKYEWVNTQTGNYFEGAE